LLLQPLVLLQEQVPAGTLGEPDCDVNGMLIKLAPAAVLVVLEMPGEFGIVIVAPSDCPASVVPDSRATFPAGTPAFTPPIVIFA